MSGTTLTMWFEITSRGTSGDQVTDILYDWKADKERLMRRIAELEYAIKPIPVTERLPKKNYNDIGDEVIVTLDYPYSRTAAMKFGRGRFYSGGFGACVVDWTRYVTHWQPLPPNPEEPK